MKNLKVLVLSAVVAVSVFGLTACGGGAANHIEINLANPITECSSMEEMNLQAGTSIIKPGVTGVADESYRVIEIYNGEDSSEVDYKIAEYEFSIDGVLYTIRSSMKTDADISGVYKDEGPAFDSAATETLDYQKSGNILVSRWSSDNKQYVLMELFESEITAEDEAAFHSISEELSISM